MLGSQRPSRTAVPNRCLTLTILRPRLALILLVCTEGHPEQRFLPRRDNLMIPESLYLEDRSNRSLSHLCAIQILTLAGSAVVK